MSIPGFTAQNSLNASHGAYASSDSHGPTESDSVQAQAQCSCHLVCDRFCYWVCEGRDCPVVMEGPRR